MTSNLTPHQHITAQLESIALGNEAAFEKAWYEICNLLIGNYAQAVSPKEVHENQIMPRLRALLSLEVAYLDKSHADNASLIAKVEKLSKAVCRRAENEEKALKEADAQSAENAKLRAALEALVVAVDKRRDALQELTDADCILPASKWPEKIVDRISSSARLVRDELKSARAALQVTL